MQSFSPIFRPSRGRSLSLTVYPDLRVVVSVPRRASAFAVERFIESRSAWVKQKLARFRLLLPPLVPKGNRRDYLKQKGEARKFTAERLTHWNQIYGFQWKRISIRNQKTRWGSCSRSGTLSFNYRIISLPPHLADYLIVHELCHIGEMNHSQRFWALVERAMPDYRKLRLQLRGRQHL